MHYSLKKKKTQACTYASYATYTLYLISHNAAKNVIPSPIGSKRIIFF